MPRFPPPPPRTCVGGARELGATYFFPQLDKPPLCPFLWRALLRPVGACPPAAQLVGLKDTLGSLRFIAKCAEHGTGSMEKLLRDFHDAQVRR
jgi:hypothetical protein